MLSVNEMPVDGQFVAAWRVDGVPFSMTFMYDEGELLAYDTFADDWIVPDNGYTAEWLVDQEDILFMVAG